jgi:amino acid transporter
LIILTIYILGTLSIVAVVPNKQLSLASGIIQAMQIFFVKFGCFKMIPLLAMFLLLGALASLNAWIVGPAKGMLVVVEDGFLPSILKRVNKKEVPVALLLLQAIVSSLLALVYVYLQDNNGAMWILTALAAQFTFMQYFLVFAAVIKLRYSQPKVLRPYKMPAVWLFSSIGVVACIFSFFIVYVPPSQINTGDASIYHWLLIITLIILSLPTVFFSKRVKN